MSDDPKKKHADSKRVSLQWHEIRDWSRRLKCTKRELVLASVLIRNCSKLSSYRSPADIERYIANIDDVISGAREVARRKPKARRRAAR